MSMSLNSKDREGVKKIRSRALELATSGQEGKTEIPPDIEALAALSDGTLSVKELDDETLDRYIRQFGADFVVDAVLQGHQAKLSALPEPTSEVGAVPSLPKKSVFRWGSWRVVALASAVAVLVVVTIELLRPRPPKEVNLALQWPSHSPFDPALFPKWITPKQPIAEKLPDFNSTESTMGPPQKDRHIPWRLATVIVRVENRWGSGTFISPDGWLLTTYHLVAEAAQKAAISGAPAMVDVIRGHVVEDQIMNRIKPGRPVKARLYRADTVHDLALLKLEEPPADGKALPYFRLASQVHAGGDCSVVGSQTEGRAWWIRECTLQRPRFAFDYPSNSGQFAAGWTSAGGALDRVRAKVIVTDARVSAGDDGGPLLDDKGELIGLTFGASQSSSRGSAGWHIALEHLRSFVSNLPDQPEGVPFDPWTAGLPEAATLAPELVDTDHDGHIDSLRYRYAAFSDQAGGSARALAITVFVDFAKRLSSAKEETLNRVPRGLWGMEDRGQFRFDVFLTVRADDIAAVGYTNDTGIVDEIRIGRSHEMLATEIWQRAGSGAWRATSTSTPTLLIDPMRIGKNNMQRLQTIAGLFFAPVPDKANH
jgi:S1-C subfamily serine protease